MEHIFEVTQNCYNVDAALIKMMYIQPSVGPPASPLASLICQKARFT